MDERAWGEFDDIDSCGDDLRGRIKSALDPTEYLLWVDRPLLPRPLRVPFVPALFVSVIAGLSGFSLAAMFGLIGQGWGDQFSVLLALGLAPVVLGGMIGVHLVSLAIRRSIKRRRLARLIYALTDRRAIVARVESKSGLIDSHSLHPGEVVDIRRFENPDGSGDLYFLGRGRDSWLPFDFLEVPRVGLVESLARETLLSGDDWWRFGTAGAH